MLWALCSGYNFAGESRPELITGAPMSGTKVKPCGHHAANKTPEKGRLVTVPVSLLPTHFWVKM